MSVYTDIYNSGVAAYDTASQDKVTADQAIPVFYSTINSWSPFTTTQTDPQIIEIQRTMWATGLSMQNTITRANTALRNDKIFPDTLTNEEVANLTSGIAAINALIPQLQSTQNALNVVRAAAEAKYQQLTA